MALFTSTQDLFEIMPRGVGQETREGLEQKLRELLSVEGKTIVVLDEIPDPLEAGVPEFTVRKDTAVVLGIAVLVGLGVAFLAGRATVRRQKAKAPVIPKAEETRQRKLPEGVFDPRQRLSQPQLTNQPAPEQTTTGVQFQPEQPPKPAAPRRAAVKRKYYLAVTTTTKAQEILEYFNTSPESPIANRPDLCAYVSGRQVRIRGFGKKEPGLVSVVKKMRDPTGGGGPLGCGTFIRDS